MYPEAGPRTGTRKRQGYPIAQQARQQRRLNRASRRLLAMRSSASAFIHLTRSNTPDFSPDDLLHA